MNLSNKLPTGTVVTDISPFTQSLRHGQYAGVGRGGVVVSKRLRADAILINYFGQKPTCKHYVHIKFVHVLSNQY